MRTLIAASALLILLSTFVASAETTKLPLIVTYEMTKQREAAVDAARDPKAFWIRQIVTRIAEHRPAQPTGLKGTVTLRVGFVVAVDGHLVSKAIKISSGSQAVDKIALKMIDRAQPFPPMPAAMGTTDQAFTLPLRFR